MIKYIFYKSQNKNINQINKKNTNIRKIIIIIVILSMILTLGFVVFIIFKLNRKKVNCIQETKETENQINDTKQETLESVKNKINKIITDTYNNVQKQQEQINEITKTILQPLINKALTDITKQKESLEVKLIAAKTIEEVKELQLDAYKIKEIETDLQDAIDLALGQEILRLKFTIEKTIMKSKHQIDKYEVLVNPTSITIPTSVTTDINNIKIQIKQLEQELECAEKIEDLHKLQTKADKIQTIVYDINKKTIPTITSDLVNNKKSIEDNLYKIDVILDNILEQDTKSINHLILEKNSITTKIKELENQLLLPELMLQEAQKLNLSSEKLLLNIKKASIPLGLTKISTKINNLEELYNEFYKKTYNHSSLDGTINHNNQNLNYILKEIGDRHKFSQELQDLLDKCSNFNNITYMKLKILYHSMNIISNINDKIQDECHIESFVLQQAIDELLESSSQVTHFTNKLLTLKKEVERIEQLIKPNI